MGTEAPGGKAPVPIKRELNYELNYEPNYEQGRRFS